MRVKRSASVRRGIVQYLFIYLFSHRRIQLSLRRGSFRFQFRTSSRVACKALLTTFRRHVPTSSYFKQCIAVRLGFFFSVFYFISFCFVLFGLIILFHFQRTFVVMSADRHLHISDREGVSELWTLFVRGSCSPIRIGLSISKRFVRLNCQCDRTKNCL